MCLDSAPSSPSAHSPPHRTPVPRLRARSWSALLVCTLTAQQHHITVQTTFLCPVTSCQPLRRQIASSNGPHNRPTSMEVQGLNTSRSRVWLSRIQKTLIVVPCLSCKTQTTGCVARVARTISVCWDIATPHPIDRPTSHEPQHLVGQTMWAFIPVCYRAGGDSGICCLHRTFGICCHPRRITAFRRR